MQTQSQPCAQQKPFASSEAHCAEIFAALNSGSTQEMDHSTMEAHIAQQAREMARRMMQDAVDAASNGDRQLTVVGADHVERPHQRRSERPLHTVVGLVTVQRETYAARKTPMLAPVDAALNLPEKAYSFGVRRHVAEQAAQVSYDATVANVASLGNIAIPKRQAEEQTAAAAIDFDAFYAERKHRPGSECGANDELMVISVDGKGIVMRPDSLRPSTQKKAAVQSHKLSKRLSQGEKKDRKRMAQVATVFTIKRHARTANDIIKPLHHVRDVDAPPAPKPTRKRVWASLEKPMEGVNSDVFDEALARDPERNKTWVALVDGNKNQLGDIMALAEHHKVPVTPIIDIIHVIQYLWLAAWCFFKPGDGQAQTWVTEHLEGILKGQSSTVAAGIRRSATHRKLSLDARKGADKCADYLLKYKAFLRYDEYLKAGMPIATGVIEGACRYLVKDRMDITGARWSAAGAEAVLQVRALLASGDMDEYWDFHLEREYARNHAANYAEGQPPKILTEHVETARRAHLTRVK